MHARVCVCWRSERWLLLVCFELFHAPCFDLPSHPFIPHTPCTSGFWFAAHRHWGWRGVGGWRAVGGYAPFTETLLVLSIRAEMWGDLPMGAEGSPGAKVIHTVQFFAPLLCSLRSPSKQWAGIHAWKTTATVLESDPLTPYNMGKCIPQLQVI